MQNSKGKILTVDEIYQSQVKVKENYRKTYPCEDLYPIEAVDEFFFSAGFTEEELAMLRFWEKMVLRCLPGEQEKYIHRLQNLHLALTGKILTLRKKDGT